MELKELNWFCKYLKDVRSSQPFLYWIFVLNLVKHNFSHVSVVNHSEPTTILNMMFWANNHASDLDTDEYYIHN